MGHWNSFYLFILFLYHDEIRKHTTEIECVGCIRISIYLEQPRKLKKFKHLNDLKIVISKVDLKWNFSKITLDYVFVLLDNVFASP